MKRLFILGILALLLAASVSAKITWVYDIQTAKALAVGQNKLILIDFFAIWCGPCEKMEFDYWSTDKVSDFENDFIFLKIDIDNDRRLASQFGVRGIPYIVVADILGNKVWDVVGYQSGNSLTKKLVEMPENLALAYKAAFPFINEKETEQDVIKLAKAYAEIGEQTKGKSAKKGILNLSSRYFKRIRKGDLYEEAQLRLLLNKVLLGSKKNIEKKMRKITDTGKNQELRKLILEKTQ